MHFFNVLIFLETGNFSVSLSNLAVHVNYCRVTFQYLNFSSLQILPDENIIRYSGNR